MTKMFEMAGDDSAQAAANAATVMKLQMRLAMASRTPVENRNPKLSDNKMTLADADKISPNLNWEAYIAKRGAPAVTEINVGNPTFLKEVSAMLTDVSIDEVEGLPTLARPKFRSVRSFKEIRRRELRLFRTHIDRAKEQQPRWRRVWRRSTEPWAKH